jgi:hypothetical protein
MVDGLAESEASSQPVHHAKARQRVLLLRPGTNDVRREITSRPLIHSPTLMFPAAFRTSREILNKPAEIERRPRPAELLAHLINRLSAAGIFPFADSFAPGVHRYKGT